MMGKEKEGGKVLSNFVNVFLTRTAFPSGSEAIFFSWHHDMRK